MSFELGWLLVSSQLHVNLRPADIKGGVYKHRVVRLLRRHQAGHLSIGGVLGDGLGALGDG
eukprot:6187412-Pleurochrysis_carterae.AAC.1